MKSNNSFLTLLISQNQKDLVYFIILNCISSELNSTSKQIYKKSAILIRSFSRLILLKRLVAMFWRHKGYLVGVIIVFLGVDQINRIFLL